MFKRAVTSFIVTLTLFASSLSFAGGFIINVPEKVKQGERIPIEVKSVQRGVKEVRLSVSSREQTQTYDLKLVKGAATQAYTFATAGSIILKVTNNADEKDFTTKSLHVQFVPGGK